MAENANEQVYGFIHNYKNKERYDEYHNDSTNCATAPLCSISFRSIVGLCVYFISTATQ